MRASIAAETAGHLLLDFERAQIPFGLVVVEGDGQIIEEGQHRLVSQEQSRQQVARRRLPEPPALAWGGSLRGDSVVKVLLRPQWSLQAASEERHR